ncbi:TolC family protein [Geomonas subterranea]|uniref:TolC family protein n=1 Tax=Geomonas subterranea TaxID=2847989 RepID=A0ABX8LLW2_9BACT|nr:TolC family protein [Geomonas subterranea]QXE92672.1 TolC family protein [Geomonas subterranea]QXM09229.1 TolC family protein [Geomonas subterranea]
MKRYGIFTLLVLLLLQASTGFAQGSETRFEELAPLIERAVAENPELKASRARWQMFLEKIPQAKALEDPMLMLKLDNLLVRDPLSTGGRDPATAKIIGISQQIPFWGKRDLREEVARSEAQTYKWGVEERKLQLVRLVKQAYYQIYSVDRALEVVEKNIKMLADLSVVAETKYSVGQGVQQDIYKSYIEKSKMLEAQITLQQQRKSLQANLNYLLYRPTDTAVAKIPDFNLPTLTLSSEALQQAAVEKRPEVKGLQSQVQKGQAAYRLAQKEYYPDFNVSFEYMLREKAMNDPGYDMYTLGLTFNLPFQQSRRQAQLAEASSGTDMAKEELNVLKNNIRSSISDLQAQMERYQKQVDLYRRGIIPQASQALESAIISYRVNKVDFLTVLDARINLFNYEKELYESQAQYMNKLAELEAVVGADPAAL